NQIPEPQPRIQNQIQPRTRSQNPRTQKQNPCLEPDPRTRPCAQPQPSLQPP
ncbi:PREDICTED: LOW QUALITY PROTEIN: keratinocyte proline-rich protein-like, partial [Pterocles gutturalis]|uniref:LOW QUALITY PROTEIN: keratinocyte proline-rich protein-like n=1 Tax=Pterocles gutturalis TaxID=240206 RepID=UPI000528950D